MNNLFSKRLVGERLDRQIKAHKRFFEKLYFLRSVVNEYLFFAALAVSLVIGVWLGFVITQPPEGDDGERIFTVDVVFPLDERMSQSYLVAEDPSMITEFPDYSPLDYYLVVDQEAYWQKAADNPGFQQFVSVERLKNIYRVHYLLPSGSAQYFVDVEQTQVDLSRWYMAGGRYTPRLLEPVKFLKNEDGTSSVALRLIWFRDIETYYIVVLYVLIIGMVVSLVWIRPKINIAFEYIGRRVWPKSLGG